MATTDNKVLDGAGVEKLSQLVKDAIAQGGGTEYSAGPGIEISSENEITNSITGGLIPYILTDIGGNWSYANFSIGSYRNINSEMTNDEVYQLWRTTDVLINQGRARTLSKQDYPELPDTYDLITAYDSATDTLTKTTKSTGMNGFQIPGYAWVIHDTVFSSYTYAKQFYKALYGKAISVKNFTNFNGGSLPTTFGNIDQALTNAKALATTETPGTVIPDGTTITIDSNGVISSQGGGGSSLPTDPVVDGSYKLVNTVATVEGTQTATQSWEINKEPNFSSDITGLSLTSGQTAYSNSMVIGEGASIKSTGQIAIGSSSSVGSGSNIAIGHSAYASTGNYGALAIGAQAKVYNWRDSYQGAQGTAIGYRGEVRSNYQTAIGCGSSSTRITDGYNQFDLIISNNTNKGLAFGATDKYMSGDLYVGCTDYTTTSSGLQTANCGGQKVFYGTLTSTDTAPTVEGAINWVYK